MGWGRVVGASVHCVVLTVYSTGHEEAVKCLYGRFAYKVILQDGQVDNNLETQFT